MSQGFYPSASNIYSSQRTGADKFQKLDTLASRVKPRQSQPPLMMADRKGYPDISKFSKDKDPNSMEPYPPSSNFNQSYRAGDHTDMNRQGPNSNAKIYVNPYSQFPQTTVQPRLSKTLQSQDETTKRTLEGHSSNTYSSFKDPHRFQIQSKRSFNQYQALTSASTPMSDQPKRVPRFSQPVMLSHDDNYPKYNPNPSPCKTTNYVSDTVSSSSHTPKTNASQKYMSIGKIGSSSSNYSSSTQLQTAKKNELKISDFVKGTQLGNGKFGTVYVARHRLTGFLCAIKEISKSIIVEENIVNQFVRELKIQSCLEHPNIVKLYGFFHDKTNIYLLLELGSQGQLYKVIKEKRKLSEATVSFIIRQLCEAVKYLHGLNIIHRDIKPQNIVLQYGTVKICDFGWSVCRSGELRSTFCGTPLYVSPEILKGELYDQKIDIWALGILTYELLVGDTPFEIFTEEELVKIIKQDIKFPSDVVVSSEAKDFVLKILMKNPDQRMKIGKLIEHPFLNRAVEVFELDI